MLCLTESWWGREKKDALRRPRSLGRAWSKLPEAGLGGKAEISFGVFFFFQELLESSQDIQSVLAKC